MLLLGDDRLCILDCGLMVDIEEKDADGLLSSTITMSYFTDSKKLQGELELSIEDLDVMTFNTEDDNMSVVWLDYSIDLQQDEIDLWLD